MGSFGGHALPGSFFILYALYHAVRTFLSYYRSRARHEQFTSKVMMDSSCCCGRLKNWPLEGYFKIFLVAVGGGIEIYTAFSNGHFVYLGNGQHATMFFFFGVTGVIDVLTFYKAPLPPDTDYISNVLALLIEGLLFKFHLHGRTDLDVLVHTFLVYTIFLGVFSMLVEMKFRHNLCVALIRIYLFLLQGTWFWQLGFILYNPIPGAEPWKQDDHEQMLIATMYFAWHCGGDFILVLLIGSAIGVFYRKRIQYADVDYVTLNKLVINKHDLDNESGEDSDVEFQRRQLNQPT